MSRADALSAAWYGDGRVPWWTVPLSIAYGGLTALRRTLYRHGWLHSERLPVPVIVIGNLTVGGTGKTPLAIALATFLRTHGYAPGVVSRGYGGHRREPLLLDEQSDPAEVGDEPCLIRSHGIPVAVGRDRTGAARLLLAAGCNLIIADDGLQHYRLARDIEICVIDGARRFGNGRLLPAGPLREPPWRLRTIDLRVCNGDAATGEYAMRLHGDEVRGVLDNQPRALHQFAGQRVHAVAGIGNPARFFASLRAHGLDVIEHPFPDHHAFASEELAFADALPVLMTDKDAIKCRAFAQAHWWRVPVQAALPEPFFDGLLQRLDTVAHKFP